jgi:hypothetical protein
MSTKLSETMDSLLEWIISIEPELAEGFQPGLLRSEIERIIVDHIPHTFPSDFYELYEWRNGNPNEASRSLGPIYYFTPLQEVISFQEWASQHVPLWPPKYNGYSVLPFITSNGEHFAIAQGCTYNSEAHIVFVDEIGETTLRYDSITSMMESILECSKANAYSTNTDGWVEENYDISAQILRRKNPKTLATVQSIISDTISIYGFDSESEEQVYISRVEPFMNALQTAYYFRPVEISSLLQDTLLQLQNVSTERASTARTTITRWLESTSSS